MLTNQSIIKLGQNAIIDFYQTMSIDHLQLPGLNIFVTGADSPSLNVVIDKRKNENLSIETINLIIVFFAKYKVPWGWFITDHAKENELKKYDFSFLYENPAMYFNLLHQSFTLNNFVSIEEQMGSLRSWIEPIREGFPSDDNCERYRNINEVLLQMGETKLKHFTAYYNNEAAASGTLFLSEQSVMLHNLATKNKFRNLGIGTSLTLYMMHEAKKCGYEHCFLDSSEEGLNLYTKIGFKKYYTTWVYQK